MKRLPRLIAIMGLFALSSLGVFVTAPAAFAEHVYECSSCTVVSGPNENPIDDVWGENRSGNGLCTTLWRFNGGESYTLIKNNCTSTTSIAIVEAEKVNGHGTTKRWFECCTYSLWGWQRNV